MFSYYTRHALFKQYVSIKVAYCGRQYFFLLIPHFSYYYFYLLSRTDQFDVQLLSKDNSEIIINAYIKNLINYNRIHDQII